MMEGVMKGLFLWMYSLVLDCVQFFANALLEIFKMDITYFQQNVPVVIELSQIFVAVGWALLMGNLAFQALKGMTNGLGYEPEDPKILFCRTAVFAFLLFASPEICKLGMNLTSNIIALMQVPDAVVIATPSEGIFSFSAGWLFTVIVGIVMMFQLVKFFFEIGERYVLMCILTFLAPLAFAMGGSKATKDIFTGWFRMFGSMCFIMVMNVFFMKILLSAMITVPSAFMVMPWLIFIVGIAKVGRKIDDIVCRIGLNAPHTGGGRGMMPGALTMMIAKTAMASIGKAGAANASATRDTRTAHAEKSAPSNINLQKEKSMDNSRFSSEQKAEDKSTTPQYRAENAQGGKRDLSRTFAYSTQSSKDKYSDTAKLDIPFTENSSKADNRDKAVSTRLPLRGGFAGGIQSVKSSNIEKNGDMNKNETSRQNSYTEKTDNSVFSNKANTPINKGVVSNIQPTENHLQNNIPNRTQFSVNSIAEKANTQAEGKQGLQPNTTKAVQDNAKQDKQRRR